MKRDDKHEKLTVTETPHGVYIDGDKYQYETRWWRTIDALHSFLASLNFKRLTKQEGSDIGGEYWR